MNTKKILLVCAESDNIINFRKELIIFLFNKGFTVDIISSDKIRKQEIMELGVHTFASIPFKNRSKNPFQLKKLVRFIRKTIKSINPDFILSFQAKPNIATSKALKRIRFNNFFCFLEGIGSIFDKKTIKQKLLARIVYSMYKKCFLKAKKVFVLNHDDEVFLVDLKLLNRKKIIILNGIGIDYRQFLPSKTLPEEKNVIMLSRLVKEKGVIEYAEIAKMVREKRNDIRFFLYGQESVLKVSDIQKYIDNGDIIYGDYCRSVIDKINESRILALPSYYREGLPRSILEAMALKRAVIAYDNTGTRDVVFNNKTGYLVKKFDRISFANKILEVIDNDNLLKQLGDSARAKCETTFSSDTINQKILDTILL